MMDRSFAGLDAVDRELRAIIDEVEFTYRFEHLDPSDRMAVWLAYFHGADYPTIAQIQNEDVAETVSRLTRAMDVLVGRSGAAGEATR